MGGLSKKVVSTETATVSKRRRLASPGGEAKNRDCAR